MLVLPVVWRLASIRGEFGNVAPHPSRPLFRGYANRARPTRAPRPANSAEPAATGAGAVRKRWADLIHRVYEVDPLTCPHCGAAMRIVSIITAPRVIRRILDHLAHTAASSRAPPRVDTAAR